MKQSDRTLNIVRLVPASRIMGPILGLLVCIMAGLIAGCSSNDGKGGGGDGSQTKAKKESNTGGGGDKKSFTQGVLNLDPKKIPTPPKGAKAKHAPGSVADLLQALGLAGQAREMKGMPGKGNLRTYSSPVAITMKSDLWQTVFGSIKVINTFKGKFGDRQTWEIQCTDGTVLLLGLNQDNLVTVDTAHWDMYLKDYCLVK